MTAPVLVPHQRSDDWVARPPGPGGAAFVRALTARRPRSPVDLFTRIARAYPRVAHTRVFGEHVYVLSHPELVREVLVSHGRQTMKSRGLQMAKHLLGEGLLTSEGELHRRQRRLIQPAFHAERIARYAEEMVTATLEHEERWRARLRGEGAGGVVTVELSREMSALTLAVVGRTLFGTDLRGDAGQVGQALEESMRHFRRVLLPFGERMLRLPLPWSRRALAAGARLDTVVRQIIAERRDGGPDDAGDLLSMLLLAREDGVGMSDEQVRDEVMTLLLAGHETTANALTWTMYLLARNPEAAEPVYREVHEQLGDRVPGYPDVARLAVTTAAVAEGMRLFPPAWIVGRRLTAPIQLDGWMLPIRSVCLASQWVLHRDPRFWPEPLTYRPGRWLTAAGRFDIAAPGQPRGAYYPFGMGSRMCIGESFAWTEAVIILATLLRRWRPEPVPEWPVDVRPVVTLRPAYGMGMRLRACA